MMALLKVERLGMDAQSGHEDGDAVVAVVVPEVVACPLDGGADPATGASDPTANGSRYA